MASARNGERSHAPSPLFPKRQPAQEQFLLSAKPFPSICSTSTLQGPHSSFYLDSVFVLWVRGGGEAREGTHRASCSFLQLSQSCHIREARRVGWNLSR